MIGMTYVRSEARASLFVRDAHSQISGHGERKPALDNMVQTKAGTKNNPWLEHLRLCAAEYQRRRAVSSVEEQSVAATGMSEKPVRRRVVGKKADAKAFAPPKEVELPEDTDKPTVKAQGKRRAKKAMNNS